MSDVREQCAQAVTALASWATSIDFQKIPKEVHERAVRVLTDDLSAIIGARNEPEVRRFHERTLAAQRPSEATVFRGGRPRTDRLSAAVANAVAADWLELDEGYRNTPCHAGLYVLPALLAEAETRNLAFGELVRALALGYEVVTRIARGWTPKALNMQSHGRYSAIGAAAGIGFSKNLEFQSLLDAISAAVTLIGPSPRNHLAQGVLARNVWPACGAWSGMMAVEWAACGIAGTPGAFYDVYSTILGGEAHPERLTAGLGERWAILDGYTKIYACCQHLHSAVEAAIELRPRLLGEAALEDIERIEVETHPLAMPLMNPRPHTTLAAKFSMSHAMAAALATGSGGAEAFAATTLEDPAITRLRPRVSVKPWLPELAPPNDRPARVSVALRGGRTLAAECLSARGGPDRPLPAQVVLEKMDALAVPVYPAIRQVFDELMALEPRRLRQGWGDIVQKITTGG
ncbi:MAG: MmgE/PrpD family protein [Betaproteobacteria bacterium]|nr:MAG: MmgE/PrpD family protein [Betaproteobacteria bacterium]